MNNHPKKGTKNDNNYMEKPPVDLLTYEFKFQTAQALGFGASKYGRHNFKEGIDWSRLIAAADRHLTQFNNGEDLDSESGLSHLAHAAASLNLLMWMVTNRPDLDDRYKNKQIPIILTPDGTYILEHDAGGFEISKFEKERPDNSTE